MNREIDVSPINKWLSAGCGFFLAAVFGVIGIGAFLERRLEAIPIGLIMSFLALYALWSALKCLRARKTPGE